MRIQTECERATRIFSELMQKRGWSADTIRAYERGVKLLTQWLVTKTTIASLNEVTAETIAAWRDEIASWNVAESTRQLRLSAVKTFFAMMCEAGVIESNPAAAIVIAKWRSLPARPRPVPTVEHIEKMIGAASAGRDRAVIEVLYGAGLRGCELRALTRDDIDLENACVNVHRGKGGKSRIVPIGAAAVDALRSLMNRSPSKPLFAFSARTLRRIIARTSRRMYSPHRLRHAFATHLLQNGAQLDEVRQLLGHAWLDTTQRYVHVETRDLGEVVARFHPRR